MLHNATCAVWERHGEVIWAIDLDVERVRLGERNARLLDNFQARSESQEAIKCFNVKLR